MLLNLTVKPTLNHLFFYVSLSFFISASSHCDASISFFQVATAPPTVTRATWCPLITTSARLRGTLIRLALSMVRWRHNVCLKKKKTHSNLNIFLFSAVQVPGSLRLGPCWSWVRKEPYPSRLCLTPAWTFRQWSGRHLTRWWRL